MLTYEDAIIEEGLYIPYLVKTRAFYELECRAAEVLKGVGLNVDGGFERELRVMSGFALASFIAANTSFSTDDEGWLEHCREICEPSFSGTETDAERNGSMSSWRTK